MNHIKKVRAEIKELFDSKLVQKTREETFTSPHGKYRILASYYAAKEEGLNWEITRVEVFEASYKTSSLRFFCNDGSFFHAWFSANNTDYLICAEDIYGGQTVLDLTHRQLSGYSPDKNDFIWTDSHLSPSGKKLAITGCYWACPYIIRVYDFTQPLQLPLPELEDIMFLTSDEVVTGWKDDKILITNKRPAIAIS